MWPSKSTRPSMAPTVLRLEMTSMSVDLPAPDDPISAIIIPGSSVPVSGSGFPSRYRHSFPAFTLYRSWNSVTCTPVFSLSPRDLAAKDLLLGGGGGTASSSPSGGGASSNVTIPSPPRIFQFITAAARLPFSRLAAPTMTTTTFRLVKLWRLCFCPSFLSCSCSLSFSLPPAAEGPSASPVLVRPSTRKTRTVKTVPWGMRLNMVTGHCVSALLS
mmetsp:Transcript_12046/g.33949  ORF Transcript_12046/g.33949 Transcript_12046/m.33949 type:complete len:216 (-) Transcript_12046:25-672(-)